MIFAFIIVTSFIVGPTMYEMGRESVIDDAIKKEKVCNFAKTKCLYPVEK